jgi:hypothetical protein
VPCAPIRLAIRSLRCPVWSPESCCSCTKDTVASHGTLHQRQDRLGVVLFSPFFRPHCRGFCRHSLRSCTSLRSHAQGSLFPTTRVLPFVSRFDLLPRARSRARDSPPSSSISLAASVVRLDLTVSKLDLFSGIVIELLDQKV